ncbi:MAG TPA: zf-HC2 domain-containing protein [Pyrinomonadaceae bacterium]|nr:zf-HC2 domain-containing protein [Pyrinomonadaceae bacterium]
MIAHLSPKQIEDFFRQQLHVAELLSVSEHLGECEQCRQMIESATDADATYSALRSGIFNEAGDLLPPVPHTAHAHLTSEQATLYVDNDLSGESLRAVAAHLTVCEQCALAVDDLRAFRAEVMPSLEREYRPAPVETVEPVEPVPPPVAGWWRQMLASLPSSFRISPMPAFGTALAVLLLALGGWLIWRTTREGRTRQEVAVSPSPAATQSPAAASTSTASLPTPAPSSTPSPTPALAPAAEVARLNDGGGLLTLDSEGNLSGADHLPPAYQSLLKKVFANGRIERSAKLKGLVRPPSELMGAGEKESGFSVVEPAGRVLITDRPTFRWTPLEGATRYVVELYDGDFNLVAASPPINGRSWVASQPLARGEVYAWQVKATRDGQEITSPRPPAPQARFRVLDRAKANELTRARRAYPSSHLTLGLLYAEAGLLDEAERELRLLQKANPGSQLARRLIEQVRALRRRSE